MISIITAFRGLFWKLKKDGNQYSLEERRVTLVIYTIIVLPVYALHGLIIYITQFLEFLVDVESKRLTVSRDLTKKEEKLIKIELLKK
ncbi:MULTISPECIES: hypothetical protein [Bizionia]|uniref:Uncharacterized protein n=1 Tax=Bizionia algoritergicola TaxID=291187 RepID=A0A5D0R101_9FLAO|nr:MULTISPECIES: hypothetical protein [Bizionia]OBX17815.1 hypothetical protein BAA08_15785 [Bizionia sp. APA-3]TYB74566.1 hypothetical protein ES675_00020 [Bizionia algoritergicola]